VWRLVDLDISQCQGTGEQLLALSNGEDNSTGLTSIHVFIRLVVILLEGLKLKLTFCSASWQLRYCRGKDVFEPGL